MNQYPSFDSNTDTGSNPEQEPQQQIDDTRQREIEAIQNMDRWALIDGTSLLHRAYHAFKNKTAPDGHNTGVLFGTLNFIHKYLKAMNNPEHAIVVFDAPGGSFERQMLYPEYKKQRPSRPEEITVQEPWVHAFLKASGIPVVSIVGVESDDVLATIAKNESHDKRIGIFSPDKDMGQCIKKNVLWYRPDKEAESGAIHMSKKVLAEKFAVEPNQFVDFLTLLGDTADNLPGIKGVGDKTAARLLKEFGSIDGMFKAVEDIGGLNRMEKVLGASKAKSVLQSMQESKEIIPKIRNLIELRDAVDVPRELYANREPVNDQMMLEMAAEHGLPPWLGYFLTWQQERMTEINRAKNEPASRMKM